MNKNIVLIFCLSLFSACTPLVIGGAARTGGVVIEERSFGTAIDDKVIHTTISELFLRSDVNDLLVNVNVWTPQHLRTEHTYYAYLHQTILATRHDATFRSR